MNEEKQDTSWVSSLIGLVVALIVGGIAVFSAWKSGRDLAKLRHEQEVEKEKKREAELALKTEQLAEKKDELLSTVEDAEERIRSLETAMHLVAQDRTTALERVDQITSWGSFTIKRENALPPPVPPSNPFDDSVSNDSEQS